MTAIAIKTGFDIKTTLLLLPMMMMMKMIMIT